MKLTAKPIEYALPGWSDIMKDKGRYTTYKIIVTNVPVMANRRISFLFSLPITIIHTVFTDKEKLLLPCRDIPLQR